MPLRIYVRSIEAPTALKYLKIKNFSTMEMKEEIYTIIRNDIPLREKLGKLFGITDASVWRAAARKAPKLIEYPSVKIIMEHTGKTEEEVFDMEISK